MIQRGPDGQRGTSPYILTLMMSSSLPSVGPSHRVQSRSDSASSIFWIPLLILLGLSQGAWGQTPTPTATPTAAPGCSYFTLPIAASADDAASGAPDPFWPPTTSGFSSTEMSVLNAVASPFILDPTNYFNSETFLRWDTHAIHGTIISATITFHSNGDGGNDSTGQTHRFIMGWDNAGAADGWSSGDYTITPPTNAYNTGNVLDWPVNGVVTFTLDNVPTHISRTGYTGILTSTDISQTPPFTPTPPTGTFAEWAYLTFDESPSDAAILTIYACNQPTPTRTPRPTTTPGGPAYDRLNGSWLFHGPMNVGDCLVAINGNQASYGVCSTPLPPPSATPTDTPGPTDTPTSTPTGGVHLPPGAVTFFTDGAGINWAVTSGGPTEFLGSTIFRTRLDLSQTSQARLIVNVGVAASTGSVLQADCGTDTTFTTTGNISTTLPVDSTGLQETAWTDIGNNCVGDVYIRIIGNNGDDSTTATFGLIMVEFR